VAIYAVKSGDGQGRSIARLGQKRPETPTQDRWTNVKISFLRNLPALPRDQRFGKEGRVSDIFGRHYGAIIG
jgi:hypothetical protein